MLYVSALPKRSFLLRKGFAFNTNFGVSNVVKPRALRFSKANLKNVMLAFDFANFAKQTGSVTVNVASPKGTSGFDLLRSKRFALAPSQRFSFIISGKIDTKVHHIGRISRQLGKPEATKPEPALAYCVANASR